MQSQHALRCSFLEIYNETITDLLDPSENHLHIREDIKKRVYVEGLTQHVVRNGAFPLLYAQTEHAMFCVIRLDPVEGGVSIPMCAMLVHESTTWYYGIAIALINDSLAPRCSIPGSQATNCI